MYEREDDLLQVIPFQLVFFPVVLQKYRKFLTSKYKTIGHFISFPVTSLLTLREVGRVHQFLEVVCKGLLFHHSLRLSPEPKPQGPVVLYK
jgi:hypothetical protein